MSNEAVVWSQPSCHYCNMAKQLLRSKGYVVEEKIIGSTHTKEEFFSEMPKARGVPQIFLNGEHVIGGWQGLKAMFDANSS